MIYGDTPLTFCGGDMSNTQTQNNTIEKNELQTNKSVNNLFILNQKSS